MWWWRVSGAWALARSGVGTITLADLDHISESNINRQLHAVTDTIGQSKVVAMSQRIKSINPECTVHTIDDFVTPENISELLDTATDVVIDCTDQVSAKIAMILEGRERNVPVLVCGGAGGLRNMLRRQHRYPKASTPEGKRARRIPRMGVWALWFEQPVILPDQWTAASGPGDAAGLQGLSCAGYGSVVTVTASMGMAAANQAMALMMNKTE